MSGSVARRYAKALFSVADGAQILEQTAAELQVLRALTADEQIAAALANPLLSPTSRRNLAGTIADNLKLSPTTRNFLSLLADHRRLDQLGGIAAQFERILDARLNRVRASITSATALSDAQRQAVIAAFEQKLGRSVLADTHIDPQLLGGVVVDVEGTIYDGSVRTQLHALAHRIAGGRSLP
jgi:F-type H+-transporting ATPase subunit delta